jgi:hypothetical protein
MGFCTTFIRRSTIAGLLAALAACEQSAPAAFDPAGAAADAAVLEASFESPLLRGLAFAGAEIDRATGGAEAEGRTADADTGFSDRLLRRMTGSAPPAFSAGELPPAVVGRTFVFDAESGMYVASESEGAPAGGVRFRLYAIDGTTGAPAEPLAAVGYADVIADGSSAVRIRVSDDTGVRLDYAVTGGGSDAESRIEVEGFAMAGTTRADFAFDSRIELTGASSGMMQLREARALPARSVSLECASVMLVRAGLPPALQLELMLRGPNGEVGLAGEYELGGTGALAVDVNGDSYATVTLAGSDRAVSGTAGEALPASALDLVDRVVSARESGLELFDRLVRPVETLIAP